MPLSTNLGHSNHVTFAMRTVVKNHIDHAPILIALGCQILHYPRGHLFCKVFLGIEPGKVRTGRLTVRLRDVFFAIGRSGKHSRIRGVFSFVAHLFCDSAFLSRFMPVILDLNLQFVLYRTIPSSLAN